MAYEIHITRGERLDGDGGIAIAEWIEAVEQADGCRLAEGDYLVTLPETGQVFRFHNTGGDTEVRLADGSWRRVFRWSEGRVSFVGPKDFDDAGSHLRSMARVLAEALGARIVGDRGETYR